MKVAIIIDGGAGRVLSSTPAILRYIRENPDHEVNTIVYGWTPLMYGIPEIQKNLYDMETAHLFTNVISKCDVVYKPEPYILPSYFRQQVNIAEAFDELLNGRKQDDQVPVVPCFFSSKTEKLHAGSTVSDIRKTQGKDITIVIQPFGQSAETDFNGNVADSTVRSMSAENYISLVQKLSQTYNVIFFGENTFHLPQDVYTYKIQNDLRGWASIIEASDYFIGCDSVGQHMARAVNVPGTVILGSSFASNCTYTDYFNIIEKPGIEKHYSPIRISNMDSYITNFLNEGAIDFTEEEVDMIHSSICTHLEKCFNK